MIKKTLIAALAIMAGFITYGLVAGYRELLRRRAAGFRR